MDGTIAPKVVTHRIHLLIRWILQRVYTMRQPLLSVYIKMSYKRVRWRIPCRRIPFLTVNRKDIVAFACNDDVDKSQLMQPFSEFLRDIGRVHGQWQLSDIYPFTKKCSFELCQHAYE